jgi:hypothetical protein
MATSFQAMPLGTTGQLSPIRAAVPTDDLEGDLNALKSRGVEIEADIKEMPWGQFVTFDDPDGNGIVLQNTTA